MNVDAFGRKHRKDECCGCTACVETCPVDAIRMTADGEGFLYPAVNGDLCIDCGKCIRACAFLNHLPQETQEAPSVYGVRHQDEGIRRESRSGGAFTLISDRVLERGGIVYGSGYTEDFRVVHKRAVCKEERDQLRKSKYVQSDMSAVLPRIKADVESGRQVLFSGTACQVAAVRKACGDAPNLYTIDIICHGVPSPLIWEEYMEYAAKKCKGETILDVDFRTKAEFGWRSHIEKIVFTNKTYYSSKFRQLFYNNGALRPCCYNCKYTSINRPADFTIGDFWGLGNNKFDDNKGVSLVMCNNLRAKEIFTDVHKQAKTIDYDVRDLIHPNLKHPTARPENRAEFWNTYKRQGMEGVIKKYTMPEVLENALILVSRIRYCLFGKKD